MIPYTRQSVSDEDIEAVSEVLRSDLITQGPVTEAFEEAVARYCSVRHAIAVSHGTAALHLACLALGVGTGDVVWTSPNTFVASANCALYCGAAIDFVDIDPETYNMSVSALENKLIEARKAQQLPKVVIPVHFAGQSCDMKAIKTLSDEYGFSIIEDAAHALGGQYLNNKIGSCQYSDITIFSLHPAKIMTSGEGGLVLTNSQKLAGKISLLRTHGIEKYHELKEATTEGEWYYQQSSLGYNYRISDIQAALGLSQLKRLDDFVKKRHKLAQRYNKEFADLPLTIPRQHPDTCSSWHLYVIRLKTHEINKTRREVFEQLRNRGIGVHVHYIPVHTQPYYQNSGFQPGDFIESERYYNEALTLPLFVDLKPEEQKKIILNLTEVLSC